VAVLEGRGAVDRCVAHEAGEEVLDGLVAGSMYQVRVRAVTLGVGATSATRSLSSWRDARKRESIARNGESISKNS
jgi:hypothetical protein